MEISLQDLRCVRNDAVLLRYVNPEDKLRGFYVPANVLDNQTNDRRRAWQAEIVMWGPEARIKNHEFRKGERVFVDPVAKDCPKFKSGNETYIIAKAEDLLAEVIV